MPAAGALLPFRRLRRRRKRMQTRMRKMRRLATPPSKVSRVMVSKPGLTRAFGLGLLSATCRRGAENRKIGSPPSNRRALRSSSRGSPSDPETSSSLFDDHSLPVKEFCGEKGSWFSKELSPTDENVEGGVDGICGSAERLWID